MKTIFVVTDDCIVAAGLAQMINATEDLRMAGSCSDSDRAAATLLQFEPDVVLLDMAVITGLAVVAQIRKAIPACRICLWARHIPSELAYQAMGMGIRGILRRPLHSSEIVKCFRTLCRDEVWFEEQLMSGFFCRPAVRLTRRESELVNLLVQGLKNKEIAYRLSLSEGTVKVYLSRLFQKLNVNDRLELALYGIRNLTTGHAPETVSPSVRTPLAPLPHVGAASGPFQQVVV